MRCFKKGDRFFDTREVDNDYSQFGKLGEKVNNDYYIVHYDCGYTDIVYSLEMNINFITGNIIDSKVWKLLYKEDFNAD